MLNSKSRQDKAFFFFFAHPWIQPTSDRKMIENKEYSRKCYKEKLAKESIYMPFTLYSLRNLAMI